MSYKKDFLNNGHIFKVNLLVLKVAQSLNKEIWSSKADSDSP